MRESESLLLGLLVKTNNSHRVHPKKKKIPRNETFFMPRRNQGHKQCFMAVNEPFVEKRFWLEHDGHPRVAVVFLACWGSFTNHLAPRPQGTG